MFRALIVGKKMYVVIHLDLPMRVHIIGTGMVGMGLHKSHEMRGGGGNIFQIYLRR